MNIAKLRGKMAERGVTQDGLAKLMNVSPNTVSSKMTGQTRWYLDDVLAICEGLSLTDDEKVEIFLH